MGSGVPALSSSSKDQCQTGSVSLPPFARAMVSKSDTAGCLDDIMRRSRVRQTVLPTVNRISLALLVALNQDQARGAVRWRLNFKKGPHGGSVELMDPPE